MTECADAAKFLGLSDTSVSDDYQNGVSYDPPYCYFEGGSLKFNQGNNYGSCSSSDMCLCKSTLTATTTTTKGRRILVLLRSSHHGVPQAAASSKRLVRIGLVRPQPIEVRTTHAAPPSKEDVGDANGDATGTGAPRPTDATDRTTANFGK